MSYPQSGYPQPGYPQPGYPQPSPPRRNRGLIVSSVALVVLLAVLAVMAVLWFGGDQDNPPGSSSSPAGAGSSAGPSASASASPSQTTAAADTVTAALAKANFTCYQALPDPVVVHRCFPEPLIEGTNGVADRQQVTLQSTPAGVQAVEVEVKALDKKAAVQSVYTKAVRALSGSLLPAGDVRTILAASTSAGQLRIGWGTAEQDVNGNSDSRKLTMVARGSSEEKISFGTTKVTYAKLLATYAAKGWRCYEKFNIRRCEVSRSGAFYHVHASDPCEDAGPELAKTCKGAAVFSVSMSVAFDSVTDQLYQSIVREFQAAAALAGGQPSAEVNSWIADRLTGKAFAAVIGGLEYKILPGSGASGGHKNAVEIQVEGFNPG